MVSIAPFSDLQQAIPVRQASPIAQQRGDEQNQIIESSNRPVLTSDKEIERAVQSYERDRNEQQQFLNEGAQKTQMENYVDKFAAPTYSPSGIAQNSSAAAASSRGRYFDFMT
ncbi:hypothetical protein LPB41_22880 [Thalassospira sp. MA62]|nr:hypothetical protein [Thalassospira sp. MA62]